MGSSRPRCAEKYRNMSPRAPFVSTLALRGTCWGDSGPPWGRSGRQLAVCRLCFLVTMEEKCGLCISTPLSNGSLLLQVPASKLEPLGPKSHTRSVQSGFEGPSRSKVCTVSARCSVEVMRIARKLPGRSPDSSQAKAQSLSKLQDI